MPDVDISVFLKIFSSWQVIAVTLLMLILFPLIFYMASFGRTPRTFKKKVVRKKIEKNKPVEKKHGEENQEKAYDDSGADETEET